MFDNYDIQDASFKAANAIKLFEKIKSYSTLNATIIKLNKLAILNYSRYYLQRWDCLLRVTCDLGRMHNERFDMHGTESDLEYGIRFYEQAEKMIGELHPDYPSIFSRLGNLLLERFILKGDTLYLEKGIEKFRKADDYYRKMLAFESVDRSKRHYILQNLARGLSERYAEAGSKNDLDEAIDIYKKALNFSENDPHASSIILNNLAISLKDRFELYKKIEDINEAIELWKKSLLVEKNPKYLPSLYSHLSEGLKHRYLYYYNQFEKDLAFRDLDNALFYSQKAIKGSSSNRYDRANYLGNFGNQLSELYEFLIDSSKKDEANAALDKSIAVFEEIVNIFPTKSRNLIRSLSNLGRALREKYNLTGDISFLIRSFLAYKEASKSLYSASLNASISYKIGLRKRMGDIDDMLIETILKLRDLSIEIPCIDGKQELNWGQEAMIQAEGCKSKILAELLARSDIPVPSSIPLNLRKKEEKLLKDLRDIDLPELSRFGKSISSNEGSNALSAKIKKRDELSKELSEIWSQMESLDPDSKDYIALRRGDALTWEELKNIITSPSIALLSLFPLARRTILFILRADWDEPMILEIPIGSDAQLDIWRRFRREVHLHDPAKPLKETWDSDLIQLLKEASNYLDGIDQIIFSPGRFGCLLPWEALAQKAEIEINIATIPNLKIWPLIDRSPKNISSALVIGNPNEGDDLIYAEEEARSIAKLLNTAPLIGPQAKKEIVLKCLPKVRVAHFATHAYFSLKDPLDSQIVLADGDLSLREIMDLKIHPKLLVLSACETGMNSSLGGDEMAGFAQGFILAGAEAVLVSLWSIDDLSTATLMESFYNQWINENANNADALYKAMTEIRHCKDWNHTYHWGAFTLIGNISKYKTS